MKRSTPAQCIREELCFTIDWIDGIDKQYWRDKRYAGHRSDRTATYEEELLRKKITDDLYEVKKSKYSLDEGSEDKEDTSKHPSFDSSQALRLGWGHLVKK